MTDGYYKHIQQNTSDLSSEDYIDAARLCFTLGLNHVLGGRDEKRYFTDSMGNSGWIFFEDAISQYYYESYLKKLEESSDKRLELEVLKRLLSNESKEIINKKIVNSKESAFDMCKNQEQFAGIINLLPEFVLEYFTDLELSNIACLSMKFYNKGHDGYTDLLTHPSPWEDVIKLIPEDIKETIDTKKFNRLVASILYAYLYGIKDSFKLFSKSLTLNQIDQDDFGFISEKTESLKNKMDWFCITMTGFESACESYEKSS